jgi:CHAT domain-containing protein/tetratricopeptide (TPR) repeat protein
LEELADVLLRLERFDEAAPLLQRALSIRQAAASEPPLAYARTNELRAALARDRADFQSAKTLLDQAFAALQGYAREHPATASLLHLAGDLAYFTGDLRAARSHYDDAVTLARRILRPSHPLLALYLRKLAVAEYAFGNSATAERLRTEALAIAASLPDCHLEVLATLNDRALSTHESAEYVDARRLLQRALTLAERCLGSTHSVTSTIVNNLGETLQALGDHAEAERLHRRAVETWTTALGRSHPFVARGLAAVAAVVLARGRPNEARMLYERTLTIRRQTLGPTHPDVAVTLASIALIDAQQQRFDQALRRVDEAAAIYTKASALEDPDQPLRLLELRATIEAERGNLAAAQTAYDTVAVSREARLGPSHPLVAEARAALARIEIASGATSDAFDNALVAERLGREHLRNTIRYLPERQSLAYAARRPAGLDIAVSIAADQLPSRRDAFDATIRSRGLVLDEFATRAVANDVSDPGVAGLYSAATAARERFANLVVRSLREVVPRALLDQAQEQKEQAERELAEHGAIARAELRRAEVGLDDVRRALPKGSVLVSFVRYERALSGGDGLPVRPVPSYAAFVFSADAPDVVAFVPLGAASMVEPLVRNWRAEAGGGAGASASQAERTYRTVAARLRRVVWDPIGAHLPTASRVFIVPDGLLSLVNFAALAADDGRYLAEGGPVLHYLSTERDLVRSEGTRSARSLLAIGGATFDAARPSTATLATRRSGCDASGGLRFEDLPGSRREAAEISQLWSAAAGDFSLLTGADASEAALKKSLANRRVIHLATHGFFLGDCASRPAGTRAVGGLAPAAARNAPSVVENPLLVSGLALAGANRRTSRRPDEDDGILTAEEIAGLDLEGVEWAVLSACDTGLGEIRVGEGVFGLRRAFQIAGVRTVIMSLWSVDDQATRLWMRALYEGRLKRNLSTADAVREASLSVLRDRRALGQSTHPFYWAAFVAAGDWR